MRLYAPSPLTEVLERLLDDPVVARSVVAHRVVPAADARFARLPDWVDPRIASGLAARGLGLLWTHQATAADALHAGRDVVVVVSVSETTYWSYAIGFPSPGYWYEVFNSDVYDQWVNPQVAGNGGGVWAQAGPADGLPASAALVIPANAILVFARDRGDP